MKLFTDEREGLRLCLPDGTWYSESFIDGRPWSNEECDTIREESETNSTNGDFLVNMLGQ